MPNPTPAAPARVRARCVELASVFQSPLLEEPLGSAAPTAVRRRHAELIGQAQAACRDCPLIAGCLYAAVVEHDVAGFVAGTTPSSGRRSGAGCGSPSSPRTSTPWPG